MCRRDVGGRPPGPEGPPVGPDLDGAVEVGPEDLGPGLPAPGQDVGAGEAVGVAFAGRDEHEPGSDSREEFRRGRRGAAVVSGFEDGRRESRARVEERPLRIGPRVAHEEERHPPEPQPDDERTLVGGRALDRDGVERRVEDVDLDPALPGTGPPADPSPDDRRPQAPAEGRHQPLVRSRQPFPELSDPEVPGDRDEPAEMVGMGVREDQRVDPLDAFAPEDGRDDPLADVERAPGQASGVDEHDAAARELDQDGLALSDIDEGDRELG